MSAPRRSAADTNPKLPDTRSTMPNSGVSGWYYSGMSSCPECGLNSSEPANSDLEPIYLDHCHGTLIVHRDHSVECTDQSCELSDLLRHAFVVDCFALGGCCRDQETLDFAAAS